MDAQEGRHCPVRHLPHLGPCVVFEQDVASTFHRGLLCRPRRLGASGSNVSGGRVSRRLASLSGLLPKSSAVPTTQSWPGLGPATSASRCCQEVLGLSHSTGNCRFVDLSQPPAPLPLGHAVPVVLRCCRHGTGWGLQPSSEQRWVQQRRPAHPSRPPPCTARSGPHGRALGLQWASQRLSGPTPEAEPAILLGICGRGRPWEKGRG